MMFCYNCGSQTNDQSPYCPNCWYVMVPVQQQPQPVQQPAPQQAPLPPGSQPPEQRPVKLQVMQQSSPQPGLPPEHNSMPAQRPVEPQTMQAPQSGPPTMQPAPAQPGPPPARHPVQAGTPEMTPLPVPITGKAVSKEDLPFQNIAEKIKVVAKIVGIGGAVLSLAAAVVLFILFVTTGTANEFEPEAARNTLLLVFGIVGLVMIPVSIAASYFMYGFGQLVEKVDKLTENKPELC